MIQQIKALAIEMSGLLEKASPKFVELDAYENSYIAVFAKYLPAVGNYILENDKTCYYPVRKARSSPLVIMNDVMGMLTKCIGHRDKSDKRC